MGQRTGLQISSLLGWRPSLLGWRPLLIRLEAIAIELEAIAIRLEAIATSYLSYITLVFQDSEFECASSIAYLYQLVPGCASKSFGLECARKAGLSPEVLQRAQEVLDMIEQKKQVPVKAGTGLVCESAEVGP